MFPNGKRIFFFRFLILAGHAIETTLSLWQFSSRLFRPMSKYLEGNKYRPKERYPQRRRTAVGQRNRIQPRASTGRAPESSTLSKQTRICRVLFSFSIRKRRCGQRSCLVSRSKKEAQNFHAWVDLSPSDGKTFLLPSLYSERKGRRVDCGRAPRTSDTREVRNTGRRDIEARVEMKTQVDIYEGRRKEKKKRPGWK